VHRALLGGEGIGQITRLPACDAAISRFCPGTITVHTLADMMMPIRPPTACSAVTAEHLRQSRPPTRNIKK